jgi:hypothetical protein
LIPPAAFTDEAHAASTAGMPPWPEAKAPEYDPIAPTVIALLALVLPLLLPLPDELHPASSPPATIAPSVAVPIPRSFIV